VTAKVRIDKWLWAARFYKTRALARDAIKGGKVQLNGTRVKPGKTLSIDDQLTIRKGEDEFQRRRPCEHRAPGNRNPEAQARPSSPRKQTATAGQAPTPPNHPIHQAKVKPGTCLPGKIFHRGAGTIP